MNLKIALAAALVVLPVAAAAPSISATQVVEGHTTFVALAPEGSDLAAIAGSVDCEVKWFDGQVLFRASAGTTGMCGDARFVYAYPAGAPDPRGNPTLRATQRVWDFADPNAAGWHVAEYEYRQLELDVSQDLGLPEDALASESTVAELPFLAWVVETGPAVHDATIDEDYNFVVIVDTSKLLLREPDALDGVPRIAGAPVPRSEGRSYVTLALGDPPPEWG
jgi:hypothetical protein